MTLLEQLGKPSSARLLIITCDDLGFSHAANLGVYEALRFGIATSASLMVPAPWARGAASAYRGEDIGVHLTLNAEFDLYRWGPITHAPSLLDGDGGFPRTIEDVWEHADLDEVHREWRAQIERAIYWGFDVSHLDAHLAGVELKPEFFDVYLDLAEEFRLPARLPAAHEERRIGFPFREVAADRRVVAPDQAIAISAVGASSSELEAVLGNVEAGVTELCLHPAVDSDELRAAATDWEERIAERDVLRSNGPLAGLLERFGIERVSYRALRALMR